MLYKFWKMKEVHINSEFYFFFFFLSSLAIILSTSIYISMFIIGLALIFTAKKKVTNIFSIFFLLFYLLFFCLSFTMRQYGFLFGDASDDAPTYYYWYLERLGDISASFNREIIFWLPLDLISLLVGKLSFFSFTLIVNVFMMCVLFYAIRPFKAYSIIYIYILFFLFHSNIYTLVHIYRQALATLFLMISIYYYLHENKKKSFFFFMIAFLSHNTAAFVFIPIFLMEMSVFFLNKRKNILIKISSILFLAFISLLLIYLSLYFFPNAIGELEYKTDYYMSNDNYVSFDKLSLFIILANLCMLYYSTNNNVKKIAFSFILLQSLFWAWGNWSFLARVNLLTLPLTMYLYFFMSYYRCIKYPKISILVIFLLAILALINTSYISFTNSESILKILNNNSFLHLSTGFVKTLLYL